MEVESNPALLLPQFVHWDELKNLREKKAQEIAERLGITPEEGMAILLERNRQAREKMVEGPDLHSARHDGGDPGN